MIKMILKIKKLIAEYHGFKTMRDAVESRVLWVGSNTRDSLYQEQVLKLREIAIENMIDASEEKNIKELPIYRQYVEKFQTCEAQDGIVNRVCSLFFPSICPKPTASDTKPDL